MKRGVTWVVSLMLSSLLTTSLLVTPAVAQNGDLFNIGLGQFNPDTQNAIVRGLTNPAVIIAPGAVTTLQRQLAQPVQSRQQQRRNNEDIFGNTVGGISATSQGIGLAPPDDQSGEDRTQAGGQQQPNAFFVPDRNQGVGAQGQFFAPQTPRGFDRFGRPTRPESQENFARRQSDQRRNFGSFSSAEPRFVQGQPNPFAQPTQNQAATNGPGGTQSSQFNNPQFNNPQFNNPRFNDPRFNDPRFNRQQPNRFGGFSGSASQNNSNNSNSFNRNNNFNNRRPNSRTNQNLGPGTSGLQIDSNGIGLQQDGSN